MVTDTAIFMYTGRKENDIYGNYRRTDLHDYFKYCYFGDRFCTVEIFDMEVATMLLTIFLAIVFCVAITLMMFAAVAFIQDKKFFSSAPKEAQEALLPRDKELFYGARTIGWTLMVFSFLMIIGVGVISIWDGFRSEFTFWQFFFRFVFIFSVYKIYDMICFDYFLLMKFHFFQFYFPEVESVYSNRKYGYNIKSQLLKLLVIFPAASALAAWICSRF